MTFESPDPLLTFRESIDVLRDVHLGGYVTVAVFEVNRGSPTTTVMGYLVRVDESAGGAHLALRDDPDDDAPITERPASTVFISSEAFHGGGETLDAEPPGPLGVEFGRTLVIIAGRDCVPDWRRLVRHT